MPNSVNASLVNYVGAQLSRPDFCLRAARTASRINLLQGSDVYRINDSVKTEKLRQKATVLKYGSSSLLRKTSQGAVDVKARKRNGKCMVVP